MLKSTAVIVRSASPLNTSTSSASLPTPPRTHHKRTLCRSYSFDPVIASDDGESCGVNDARPVASRENKRKRKEPGSKGDEDDEDAFWTGAASVKMSDSPVYRRPETPDASPLPVERRCNTVSSLVSPFTPKRQVHETESAIPVTPPRKRVAIVRDSPENPFWVDSDSKSNIASLARSTSIRRAEAPEVIYVWRGLRKSFINPHHNPPASVEERARLPLDHEDYSPNPACPPKRLFETALRRQCTVSPSIRPRTRRFPVVEESEEEDLALPGLGRILFREEIIQAAAGDEAKNAFVERSEVFTV